MKQKMVMLLLLFTLGVGTVHAEWWNRPRRTKLGTLWFLNTEQVSPLRAIVTMEENPFMREDAYNTDGLNFEVQVFCLALDVSPNWRTKRFLSPVLGVSYNGFSTLEGDFGFNITGNKKTSNVQILYRQALRQPGLIEIAGELSGVRLAIGTPVNNLKGVYFGIGITSNIYFAMKGQ